LEGTKEKSRRKRGNPELNEGKVSGEERERERERERLDLMLYIYIHTHWTSNL
jgi:hypothetical protein